MILGSSSTSADVGIIIPILTTFIKYDHHSKSSLQQQHQWRDDEVMLSRCRHFFDSLGVNGSGSDMIMTSSELIEACCYEAIEVLASSMEE